MPFTLTMPKLSPTMEEGTIARWRKKEGELVKEGEVIFEVATDKATIEHAVLDGGFLRKILVKEGGSAIVNQPVAILTQKADESIEGYLPEGTTPQTAKQEQPAAAIKEEKKEAQVAQPSTSFAQPAFTPEPPLKTKLEKADSKGFASPFAKKMAQEKGIDLSTVKGSGPNGRVMSRDLEGGQPDLVVAFGRSGAPKEEAGSYEEEALTPMRKTISQRLQASKTFIPHFYLTNEIDASSLLETREQLKKIGLKISVNDFVIRACALALRSHPNVNSGFNSATQSLIRFKTVDISVAVTLDEGLITPIIRFADYKNLGEISTEMRHLAQKARDGKLSREEYMGGSFTISNLGMYHVSEFVAVINPPQAAILAVAAIEEKPVVKEGKIVPGKTMKLTLSADHRVIDGVEGAKFLRSVQRLLESPAPLLIS